MVIPAQTSKIDTAGFCNLLGITKDIFRERMKAAVIIPDGLLLYS